MAILKAFFVCKTTFSLKNLLSSMSMNFASRYVLHFRIAPELIIEVIGPHVRCFRRNSSNNWKNQLGNVKFEGILSFCNFDFLIFVSA
jgi:hypothetical protein